MKIRILKFANSIINIFQNGISIFIFLYENRCICIFFIPIISLLASLCLQTYAGFTTSFFGYSLFALTGLFETWHYLWLACIRFYCKYIYVTGVCLKNKCKIPNYISLTDYWRKTHLDSTILRFSLQFVKFQLRRNWFSQLNYS